MIKHKPLKPSGELFAKSYPNWIDRVAELLQNATAETVFGLYAPWGSGKTSAAHALQSRVAGPNRAGDRVAAIVVDCSLLSFDGADLKSTIMTKLSGNVSSDQRQVSRYVFETLKRAIPIVSAAAATTPLATAGIALATTLADKGLEGVSGDKKEHSIVKDTIDLAVIFLDDLDRCEPATAWGLLRAARSTLIGTRTVPVIVCDPTALGYHVARTLQLPPADGFEAILKYIDVPLRLPTKTTDVHRELIESQIDGSLKLQSTLSQVAQRAADALPARDVLVSLPQACLWLRDVESVLPERDARKCVEVIFHLALLHTCIPSAFEVLTSLKADWLEFSSAFKSVSRGYTGPMKDSTQSAVESKFGGLVQEVVESRMDLVQYARAIDLCEGMTNPKMKDGGSFWVAISEALRSA